MLKVTGRQTVNRVSVDFAVTLETDDHVTIMLASALELRQRGSEQKVTIYPERADSVGAVIGAVLRQELESTIVDDAATLMLQFSSGLQLTCKPDVNYEAWAITNSDGELLVCKPGVRSLGGPREVLRRQVRSRRGTTTGVGATTSSYGYDATGNMTTRNRGGKTAQALTWNSEGRLATLVEGSSTSSYLYTADGDRLIRNQGGVKTLYLPGQELTYTGPTKPGTAVRYYTFAGTTVASRTTSAAESAMTLINDPQGTSTIAVASKTNTLKQRRFDPFGNARDKTAVTWQGDHTFLNKSTDTTGLTQVGARYYDSAIGSFISVAPILVLGKPQQWNGYAYAGNNPTTWSDPTGMIYEGSQAMTNESEKVLSEHRAQAAAARPAPHPSPGPRPTLPPVHESPTSTPAWLDHLMVNSYNVAAGLVNGVASVGNAIARHPVDVFATAFGIYGMIQGGGIMAAGALALPTGMGTIEGAGAIAVGGAMVLGGATAIQQGASSLIGHAAGDDSLQIMQRKSTPSSGGDKSGYSPAGNAADYDLDELAQMAYQHAGAGDLPGRPSFDQIRRTLAQGSSTALKNQNSVRVDLDGVRVIVNQDSPWRSTAYFPGK